MEVILRQSIENLGNPGDVVNVKPGYARNYLLPRGLAYEATPGNLKRIGAERQRLEAEGVQVEKRQIDLHEPIKTLGVFQVPIRLHADVRPEVRVWVIKQ